MALKFAVIALCLLQLATSLPTSADSILEDLLMVDDTVSVGSYVRETRAAAVSLDTSDCCLTCYDFIRINLCVKSAKGNLLGWRLQLRV